MHKNNQAQQLQYHKVRLARMENVMDFYSLKSFSDFVHQNHIKTLFCISENENSIEHFAAAFKGALLRVDTEGFHTLEDYKDACSKKFEQAQQYYEAMEKGFANYQEYELAAQSGLKEKQELEELRAAGFVDGLKKFQERDRTGLHPDIAALQCSNPAEFKNILAEKGFKDYPTFEQAIGNGFADYHTYAIAREHGFNTAADYEAGRAGHFISGQEYYFAKQQNITNVADLRTFLELSSIDTRLSLDACALIALLSKAEQRKKISINKLYEVFNKHLEAFKDSQSGEFFPWFTRSMQAQADVIDFITKNEHVKKFGSYDHDGEYFETKRMEQRKIVIDGSNVAYNNSKGDGNGKPQIENVIKVVKALGEKGFEEIQIIADASLKHRISDANKLPELKKMADYTEAPAERAADLFIIDFVRNQRCLLLSNDTFRDWKQQDPWVAENIDYYRLSFMINGDTVLLPDVKD